MMDSKEGTFGILARRLSLVGACQSILALQDSLVLILHHGSLSLGSFNMVCIVLGYFPGKKEPAGPHHVLRILISTHP